MHHREIPTVAEGRCLAPSADVVPSLDVVALFHAPSPV